MVTVLLIRHGHVAGIDPPRFRGRANLALSDRGLDQARKVARRVAADWSPSIVYTSPLARCVDTGAAIASASRVSSQILPDLADLDYGNWQGKTHDEARAADAATFATWLETPERVTFPAGESLQDVATRTARALQSVREGVGSETVVLVGHDSVNRVMLSQCLNMPLSAYWRIVQDPCCINEIELDAHGIRLRRMNDTANLTGD
jgi:broad specificity phosphatase PhoE